MKLQVVGWMDKRSVGLGADTNYRRIEQDYEFSGGYGLNKPEGWTPLYALDDKDILILAMYREQQSEALQALGMSADPLTRHLAAEIADHWRDKAKAMRVLLAEALHALEYHREQTRPIHRNDEVIMKLRAALPPCGECHLQRGERCDVCGASYGT